ncbi:lycopene cyclase domain-containing protein [Microbacterium indicum]|uniref:lycopene cyclase domain-containing protein n=1 Tax=Microbacterium indicum TaxID=358100 RepID=UPI001FE144E2|nr:lycopene cyclase domain-containing protein [Microbacterium indicum]
MLSAIFLAIAVATAVLAARRGERVSALALAAGALALCALTAAFDTVMIAAGLFTYADAHLLGPRIGLAPIEDFAYPLAAVILLPALWSGVRRNDDR